MSQDYFTKHLSLSDWAIQAGLADKQAMIDEDGTKRRRLRFLSQAMGLPVVNTYLFSYADIAGPSVAFEAFVATADGRPYALRANPRQSGLPVLRNRKLPVAALVAWLQSTGIKGDDYEFSFEPHIDPERAAIFVVTDSRVVGEAIEGGILQLNKGLHTEGDGLQFEYDFGQWRYSRPSESIGDFLQKAMSSLRVDDPSKRNLVEHEMGLGFAGPYLKGYFEAIWSADSGIIFIDYNRQLIRTAERLRLPLTDAALTSEAARTVRGQSGCVGRVRGRARVVSDEEPGNATIADGEILVCRFTSPDFVPLMMKAAGVVTDIGGVLSHAAIVCRELHKPCIVGTKSATQDIRSGDMVEVDGDTAVVRVLA